MVEFGRTPGCVCNVLAVLGDCEESMWATFDAAVEVAEAANSRLTLVKTCEPGRAYVWVAPFAVGGAYLPPASDAEDAARTLLQVADRVPRSIPVTTLVLGSDTQRALLELLRSGRYGAVVAEAATLSRCRRLQRRLREDGVRVVALADASPRGSAGGGIADQLSIGPTEDGALDADQVIQVARHRRRGSLRLWSGRHLAGAGGGGGEQ